MQPYDGHGTQYFRMLVHLLKEGLTAEMYERGLKNRSPLINAFGLNEQDKLIEYSIGSVIRELKGTPNEQSATTAIKIYNKIKSMSINI